MRYSCRNSVEYDLKRHYELRDQYVRELNDRSMFSGCTIKIKKKRNGHTYYSAKMPEDIRMKYARRSEAASLNAIREYAFYEEMVSIIETNIEAMERMLAVYKKTHAECVNELLSEAYTLPPSSPLLIDDPLVIKWLESHKYEKKRSPVFDEAGLTVTAFDGTKVRSRAEALHYEAFFIYDVPVIFEFPYKIDGMTYHPDFTFLDVFSMVTHIWEHLGNWFHENPNKRNKYRVESLERIDEYKKIGFFAERNLQLSFGSNENEFDVQSINRKVAMFAVPPPSPETIAILSRR